MALTQAEKTQRYRARHPDRVRESIRKANAKRALTIQGEWNGRNPWHRAKRLKIQELLGGRCVQCGFADHRALQVDHVNGDGYSDRQRTRSGYGLYHAVLADLAIGGGRYRLLCANCNWIKRWERDETQVAYKQRRQCKVTITNAPAPPK